MVSISLLVNISKTSKNRKSTAAVGGRLFEDLWQDKAGAESDGNPDEAVWSTD